MLSIKLPLLYPSFVAYWPLVLQRIGLQNLQRFSQVLHLHICSRLQNVSCLAGSKVSVLWKLLSVTLGNSRWAFDEISWRCSKNYENDPIQLFHHSWPSFYFHSIRPLAATQEKKTKWYSFIRIGCRYLTIYSWQMIKIDFLWSDEVVKSATAVVHGIVFGVPMPFPLDNPDACKNSGMTCPLSPGNQYTYTNNVYVQPKYPTVRMTAQQFNFSLFLVWLLCIFMYSA